MPQFDQIAEIYASQLFWLAIFFGAVFVVVGLGMLPKIQATVDARDAKIAGDLSEAGNLRATADRLEEGYRADMERSRAEGARVAAEAKAEAAKATEASVGAADQALSAKLAKASVRIGEARRSAMIEIESVATEATQALVQRVAGLAVDEGTARAAIAKELVRG